MKRGEVVPIVVCCDADTLVKLALMSSSGKEAARSKTSVRRGQPNPLFKETFMFQVPQVQLSEYTLMVAVHAVRILKKPEMIGWFSLGNYILSGYMLTINLDIIQRALLCESRCLIL